MKKVLVWDLAVRVFHWGLGGLLIAAFATADDDWLPLHRKVGLVILGAVVFRLAWGLWGSAPARFSAFVRRPREVLAYLRAYVRGRPPVHTSHNPLGALMVLALLGNLLAIVATGLLLAAGPEGARHDVEELHEALAGLLLILAGVHVAGVIVSSILERQNLVLGMITGRKLAAGAPPATATPLRSVVGLAGAALLAFAAVRAVMVLFPIAAAEAAGGATPAALLRAYEDEARRADAAFARGDATKGRALFVTEVAREGARRSCATCHTADPRKPGKSTVGEEIPPLSPLANPDGFTDRKHADKWFDRNCKQVLGRVCTPAEKSNLLAYLLVP
jgi:cytochrome b